MNTGQRAAKRVGSAAVDTVGNVSIKTEFGAASTDFGPPRPPAQESFVNSSEPAAPEAIDAASAAAERTAVLELFVVDSRGAQQRLRVTEVSAAPLPAAARATPARAQPPASRALAGRDAPEIRRIAAAMGNGAGTEPISDDPDK